MASGVKRMKSFRYLAIALGGVPVLLLALGAYVALTFDAERVKSELARIVQEKTQRTLRIDGAADLTFWPGIGVKLEQLSLSERASDQVFACLDSARVSLRPLPLLRKHIVIDVLELAGARATVVRHKDGSTNIDDLLARQEPSAALRFDIGGVKLERAHLAYRDEQTGQSAALSDLNVDTGRLGLAAAGKLSMATRFALAQPQSTGELKLAGSYRYDLEGGDITVSDVDAKLSGDLAGMKGVDAAATAGRLQLQRAGGTIAAEQLALSLTGKGQAEAFELTLATPGLELAGGRIQGEVVKVTAKLSGGSLTVDGKLDLSGVSGSRDALAIAKLTLVLDAKFGDRTIKGILGSPVIANLQARTVELPKYGGEFDFVDPLMPVKNLKLPITGSLRGDLARGTAAGRLSARFDDSQIQAEFDVTRFDPLALAFDVDIDRLNADRYRAARSTPSAAAGAASLRGIAKADEPIDLSALKKLDARGRLHIGQLQVADVKANNVRMEIRSAGGRLHLQESANVLARATRAEEKLEEKLKGLPGR
jgi:AsmA protein